MYEQLEQKIRKIKGDIYEPTCDFPTKERIYKEMRDEVNKFIPLPDRYKITITDSLEKLGALQISNIFTKEQTIDICNYLKTKKVYDSHIPSPEPPSISYEESENQFNSYSTPDVLESPHILKAALDPKLIGIISNYFGCLPTLYSTNIWHTKPSDNAANIQRFHRDFDDFKFVTVLVYLKDVDEESGPHMFIPRSHDIKPFPFVPIEEFFPPHQLDSDNVEKKIFGNYIRTLVGEAGTTYLLDTYGIHKGSSNVKKERLALWMRYGLHKNPPSEVQTPNPFKIKTDIILNDEQKYITRLLIA